MGERTLTVMQTSHRDLEMHEQLRLQADGAGYDLETVRLEVFTDAGWQQLERFDAPMLEVDWHEVVPTDEDKEQIADRRAIVEGIQRVVLLYNVKPSRITIHDDARVAEEHLREELPVREGVLETDPFETVADPQ